MRRLPVALTGAALLAVGVGMMPADASTPASSSVTVPAVGGTAKASFTGTIPPGSDPTSDCSTSGGALADSHTVKITAPAGGYGTSVAKFTFEIRWTPLAAEDVADEVLELLGPDGSSLGSSDGGTPSEAITLTNLASGSYTLLSCGFANAAPQDYTGTITVTRVATGPAAAAATHTVNDKLLTFTPATVVDPVLFGGEPGINFDPTSDGSRSFVDWPVSSRQNIGVLYRSTDGGLSYGKRYADTTDPAEGGPACAGRQTPFCFAGGGGDTDVRISPRNGLLAMGSQEVLVNQAVGVSTDHGTTFPADHVDPIVGKDASGVDRQWLGSYAGTRDVFLAYHVPLLGEYVNHSSSGGATGSWSVPPTPQIPGVSQSGGMVIDNTGGAHNHAIYIAYVADGLNSAPDGGTAFDPSATPLTGYAIGVSTDDGATFVNHKIPGGDNARNFVKVYLDRAGNAYAVWTDSTTQQTYLSTSKADAGSNAAAPGSQWSKPVVVSSAPIAVSIFPDVVAGDPGRIAVSYYGTTADAATPDDVQKGKGGWSPYVSVSTDALCQWTAGCTSPEFHQAVIAHHINHDDNICTSGTACAATGGNRNLLDYFDISLDPAGHLGFVWSDTTNGIGMPFVKVTRQASGPSLYAGSPAAALPQRADGAADAAGDARYPIAGAQILTAKNQPALDLRGTSVALADPKTLRVTINLADAGGIGAHLPTGTDGLTALQQAKYLVRWDYNGQVYYAGANVPTGEGSTPTYFSGAVSPAEGVIAAGATPDTYYGSSYKALGPATGRISGNALVIDVPVSAVGGPKVGAALYSVGSYALIGPTDDSVVLNTIPITVDSTPTYDVALGQPAGEGAGPGAGAPGTAGSVAGGSLAATGLPAGLAVTGSVLLAVAALAGRRRTAA